MIKKIFVYLVLAVVFVPALLIFLFDHHTPPGLEKDAWHAYLSEEEKDHPLAKYWFAQSEVKREVLAAIKAGPMQESEVLHWDDRLSLLEQGDHNTENGWRLMDDGSGYVAVRTFFPRATAEMLDWWFTWAQQEEDIRYKIWYPGAHYAMAEEATPDAPQYPDTKPYWGKSRYPVEDVGMGVSKIRLDFVPPSEFGFAEIAEDSTMIAVRVGLANGIVKHTDMIHYIRPVEGGVEMRSRFWMALKVEAMSGGLGVAAYIANNTPLKPKLPENAPQSLAFHCANEYSHLATFLPELYDLYGPG